MMKNQTNAKEYLLKQQQQQQQQYLSINMSVPVNRKFVLKEFAKLSK